MFQEKVGLGFDSQEEEAAVELLSVAGAALITNLMRPHTEGPRELADLIASNLGFSVEENQATYERAKAQVKLGQSPHMALIWAALVQVYFKAKLERIVFQAERSLDDPEAKAKSEAQVLISLEESEVTKGKDIGEVIDLFAKTNNLTKFDMDLLVQDLTKKHGRVPTSLEILMQSMIVGHRKAQVLEVALASTKGPTGNGDIQ